MSQVTFLLDVTTNYISFGLALYAIGAILTLVWMRKRNGGHSSEASTIDVVRAGACIVALVMLEVARQFWDSFHDHHFPLWLTRALLPGIYFTLGNSIFRLTKVDGTEDAPPLATKEAGRTAS